MPFYPSRRSILAVALGLPISLLLAIAAPGFWAAGIAWSLLAALLILVDVLLGASGRKLIVESRMPATLAVGRTTPAVFSFSFQSLSPATAELQLETNARLKTIPDRHVLELGHQPKEAVFQLTPLRRGEGRLDQLWLRWRGPMGLAWIQRTHRLARNVPILPDVEAVKEEAVRLFQRDAGSGLHVQLNAGSGTEFHTLRDFQTGHDPRQIDWKQSARHSNLIVKEFRAEQNQHIVAVLDTGRLMSDPLLGQPRLDRALHAILLLAYVGLKLGDRVGLFAFDSRPRLRSGTVSGIKAFAALQRLAATLDYSDAETNFTLGLTQISGDLEHRSVIVIFTDFSDSTSAEIMLESVARLLKRHLVLFVVFRDAELEAMQRRRPQTAHDASCAVIADLLLRERDVVLGRLRQLGVEIVDVPVEQMNVGVLNAYLAVKQRIRY